MSEPRLMPPEEVALTRVIEAQRMELDMLRKQLEVNQRKLEVSRRQKETLDNAMQMQCKINERLQDEIQDLCAQLLTRDQDKQPCEPESMPAPIGRLDVDPAHQHANITRILNAAGIESGDMTFRIGLLLAQALRNNP